MGLFLTNGFPEPAATGPLLDALVAGGADFVELGMPFSDPLAEGLPIQRASARALAHGVKMRDALATARAFADRHPDVPLVLMGYVNPVLRYGLGAFCRDAAGSGVAGLILPDVPLGEAEALRAEAARHGLALTFLVAPTTTDDRIAEVDRQTTGFVYAVSSSGLTGQTLGSLDPVAAYLRRARALVRANPLLVGFGIRSAADAARLSAETDGFIVGSALVEEVERLWADPALSDDARLAAVTRFVRALRPDAA